MRLPAAPGLPLRLTPEKLAAKFTERFAHVVLSTADVPTETYNAPIVGETSTHTLADLKKRREQEVDFRVAQCLLENFFRDDQGNLKPWLFPQLLAVAKQWRKECLTLKDDTFPQMLLWIQFALEASNRIYRIDRRRDHRREGSETNSVSVRPEGSTRFVDFDTSRPVYATREDRCHISHVVADTDSWEQKLAQTLESMNLVISYFKNHNVGFTIPYTLNGQERNYVPDFVVKLRTASGEINLIIEVTGEKRTDKEAKVATARTLWVPAVNNHGGFGRWAFVEIADPWDAKRPFSRRLTPRQRWRCA